MIQDEDEFCPRCSEPVCNCGGQDGCCEPERPTRVKRKMMRGNTLYFTGSVFRDLTTRQLFTVPDSYPAPSGPVNAVPFVLASPTVMRFTLKNFLADYQGYAVMELDNGLLGGVSFLGANRFSVVGPGHATATFPDSPVHPKYDLQVTEADGSVWTVEIGVIEVSPDVTTSS